MATQNRKYKLFNGGESDVCPACQGHLRIWYIPDGPDDFKSKPKKGSDPRLAWAHWMYCPACPEGRKASREAPTYSQN